MHCNRSCYRYAITDDEIVIWHHDNQCIGVLFDGTDTDFMDAWELADIIMQGSGIACSNSQ